MTDMLNQALQDYRKAFFDRLNAGYAALRADHNNWEQELEERREWDRTLADGLDPSENWTDDGRVSTRRRRKKRG